MRQKRVRALSTPPLSTTIPPPSPTPSTSSYIDTPRRSARLVALRSKQPQLDGQISLPSSYENSPAVSPVHSKLLSDTDPFLLDHESPTPSSTVSNWDYSDMVQYPEEDVFMDNQSVASLTDSFIAGSTDNYPLHFQSTVRQRFSASLPNLNQHIFDNYTRYTDYTRYLPVGRLFFKEEGVNHLTQHPFQYPG